MPKPKRLLKEGRDHHLDIRLDPTDIPDRVKLVGLDLAMYLSGAAIAYADLKTGAIALEDWKLFDHSAYEPAKLRKNPEFKMVSEGQYDVLVAHKNLTEVITYLGENNIHVFRRNPHQFVAIETIFKGKNSQSMISTATTWGSVRTDFHDLYLHGYAFDIAPTFIKKRATANDTFPFGSGHGLTEKWQLADCLQERFNISDAQRTEMTTQHLKTKTATVYDVFDALGALWALFVELRHRKGYI